MGILTNLSMYRQWLQTDPAGLVIFLLYFTVSVLLTLMLHEVAHGYVAYRCGDPTAKMLGRLSLDPRKHLDPIGTAMLVLLGFGWAKPVPVNPRNFRGNYRRDDFLVSIAGVATNLTLFIITLFLATLINPVLWKSEVITYYGTETLLSTSILFGNSTGTLSQYMNVPWLMHVQRFLVLFSTMNVSIAVFNLLPIPPLDGFHVFNDLILKGRLTMNRQFFQIAQVALLLLMFTGVLGNLLGTVIGAVQGGVLNLFLLLEGAA